MKVIEGSVAPLTLVRWCYFFFFMQPVKKLSHPSYELSYETITFGGVCGF